MTDEELLVSFERGRVDGGLRHADHVRLAWLQIRDAGARRAAEGIADGLRRLAVAHGVPGKYHHTVTYAWLRLVAAAIREAPELDTFDGFVAAFPDLLDPAALSAWYSQTVLGSDAAREHWVEPDLKPLPELAP
jgi:hypothetical protein